MMCLNSTCSAQGTITPADAGSGHEACGTSLGDLLHVKQELDDMDIGLTVLQHMDIHHTINKNWSAIKEENSIVDDCNEAMPGHGIKKVMAENKLIDNQIKACKGQTTTAEEYEVDLTSCLSQQKELQQSILRQHQASSSNGFKCDSCDRIFRKPHLLSAHKKLHARHSMTSVTKSRAVAGPFNVSRDVTAKAKQKSFKCNVCEKGYSSKGRLNAHKRLHSGIGLSVCHICDAKFSMKTKLTNHLRTHMGEKLYQCTMCDARLASSSALTRHMRVHTGQKPYQCTTCDARFADNSALTKHTRVHTGEKPYQCTTCDARFADSSVLTRHMRVHTGEKPYQCTTCDARFADNSALTRHMRVHTGEKPYQCTTCDAKFAESGGLTSHMRVHTGDKPYQCNTCDARFARNGHLTKHIRVHTGENPYHM